MLTFFSILFTYILIGGSKVTVSPFCDDVLKESWIFDTKYYPSGKWKFSFNVGADILHLLFLYDVIIFFMHSKC